MHIKQFEDKNLSHFSYAIFCDEEKQLVLIDPARNAQPYLDYAEEQHARIIAIIETHPHADFVSAHLELHQQTGATIYTSALVGALYPHKSFNEGQTLQVGKIKLTALDTPGHSPDSICVVLEHDGKQKAVFTGDTLFIGDCGRPDLREGDGNINATREELAKQMYHSLREKLATLPNDVLVYPAHGAGTLCGKNLSKENSSTIGYEKQTNWCLQEASEAEFVKNLLTDQPFIPNYFSFDVALNRQGAGNMQQNIAAVPITEPDNAGTLLDKSLWIIDTRKENDFKNGHLPHSINLMQEGKFETWLGSIIKPNEKFYLAAENPEVLKTMMERAAAIGYETAIEQAFLIKDASIEEERIDVETFKSHTRDYTIIDVRNTAEVAAGKIFDNSIAIPLAEVGDRVDEIPTNKPIVVHCAGGYRSAAASSIISAKLNRTVKVFDLGEAIKQFQ